MMRDYAQRMSQLDHIVIASPNLTALVAEFRRRTGVQPVTGGRHEGRGTANHLVGLGEGRYIELIGPDPTQQDIREPRPLRVDEVTDTTVVGWAVRPDNLAAQLASSREAGYDPGEPAPMDRTASDGGVIAWRLTPPAGGMGGTVPFLIDWQDTTHPSVGLPALTLLSLTITHPDPAAVRAAVAAVGGLEVVTDFRQGPVGLAVELETPNGQIRIG